MLEGCFLWGESGRDVDAVEAGEARGFEAQEMGVDPVPRLRGVPFPMPLFCPDRVFLEFVPIMAPGIELRRGGDMGRGRASEGGRGAPVSGQVECDIDLLDIGDHEGGRGTRDGRRG